MCNVGGTLIKVGETERLIGIAERDLMDTVSSNYLHPLKAYLDTDMKAYAVCLVPAVVGLVALLKLFNSALAKDLFSSSLV